MHECIEVMADALKLLAGGDALLPLRQMMLLPGDTGQPDGFDAFVPRRHPVRRRQGHRRVPHQPRHRARHAPGCGDPLRRAVRPAAGDRGRHHGDRDPHRGGQRGGHAAAGAAGRGRSGDHRRGDAGAHAPGGDAGRATDPPRAGLQPAAGGRTRVRRARDAASRHRGRGDGLGPGDGRGRGPHLHGDLGPGAGGAGRMAGAGRAHQRGGRVHAGDARARHGRGRRGPDSTWIAANPP